MTRRKMWFGNETHAQWVPCPASGMTRGRTGYNAEIAYESGGIHLEESAQFHQSFALDFPVADAHEYSGIEAFTRFAAHEFGSGYLRFVDPMYSRHNLFNPSWAAPGLIEEGWKDHGAGRKKFTRASFVQVAGVGASPRRAARWIIDATPDERQGQAFTFLVPPGYTLWLGGLGTVTGFGAVGYKVDGGGTGDVALRSPGSDPRLERAVSGGDAGKSVRVFLTRRTPADATVTLAALWAKIIPSAQVATIDRHLPGQGHAGLKFRGKVGPETYIQAPRRQVGMSAELVEVEPWVRSSSR